VAGAERAQLGLLLRAAVLRERAPGPKPAARRRVDRAGQLTPDARVDRRPGHLGLGDRDGRDQAGRVGVGGVLVDVLARAHLDELPEVHHADLVGHVLDHREVMGDDHEGQAVIGLEPLHQVQDLRPDGHVQRADRLVGNDDLGAQGQRPGQADALPLAAGELVRVALDRVAGQAHLIQQLEHALLLLGPAADALDGQRLADDRADPHPRVQRGVRVLEHKLQVAPVAAQLAAAQRVDVAPFQQDLAAVGRLQGHGHLADGGLAAARLADQPEGVPGLDAEGDIGHRVHGAHLAPHHQARAHRVLLDQVAHLQQRRALHRARGGRLGPRHGGHAGRRPLVAARLGQRPVDRVPAGELVLQGRAGQRRLLAGALVVGAGAPGGEPAAHGRVGQVGRDAGDVGQLERGILVEPRDRGQQRLGVGVVHVREQLGRPGLLDQAPGVHHVDPVGVPGDDAHVVGDQQHGHAQPGLQVRQQGQDLGLDGHVQGGRGLVGDQQLGLAGQRHGDHDPLPQAARQLVRVVVQPLLGPRQPDQAQDLGGPLQGLRLGHVAVQPDRLGDLVADRLGRVQRGQRVLEHHRDLVAADLAHVVLGQPDQLPAVQLDRAADDGAARRQQAHDGQARHRLAAARLPHQPQRLAGSDFQVDVAHGLDDGLRQLDVGGEVINLQDGWHPRVLLRSAGQQFSGAVSAGAAGRPASRAMRRRSGCRP